MARTWQAFRDMTRAQREGLADTWLGTLDSRRAELDAYHLSFVDRMRAKVAAGGSLDARQMVTLEQIREMLS